MKPDWWRDRHVLITGASSGIGREVARRLAQPGIRLGLIARGEASLAELSQDLQQRGANVAYATADVTDLSQMRAAVESLEARLGPCEIALANAGVHQYTPGSEFTAEKADAVIRTNVIGVTNTIGCVLPAMVARRRGHLVAISSIASVLSLPRMGTYCASKAAVVTQMNALAVDLKPFGIRVTTICPGFIQTPLIQSHNPRLLIFRLTAEQAAERIILAIEREKRICYFPLRTYALARFGSLLPFRIYGWIIRRVTARRANAIR